MLALTLLVVAAAPDVRPDGVWYPSKIAAAIAKGTASEIDLAFGVAFGPTEVTIGYGMEDETRSWRATEGGGLEVRSGEDWRPLQWKEVNAKKGIVKSDVRRAGELEELTWVAGTVAELSKARSERLKQGLLAKLAGNWAAPGHTLILGPRSALDGKVVQVRSLGCNWKCESNDEGVCPEIDGKLYFPQGKRLVEVAIEGSCGAPAGAGVEPVPGGLTFDRK